MLKKILILILFIFLFPGKIWGAEVFGILKVGEQVINKKDSPVLQNKSIVSHNNTIIQKKKENSDFVKENENNKSKTSKEIYLVNLPEYFFVISKKNILVRDSQKRIYVIENNLKRHIKTIEEIKRNYKNWKIEDLEDNILCQCKNRDFTDRSLIRGKDGMIFFVLAQSKKKVLNQKELIERFRGMKIYEVDDFVLNFFVSV